MKFVIFCLFAFVFFQSARSTASSVLEAVRSSDGTLFTLDYRNRGPETLCSKDNGHLPTKREFAEYAINLGAKGILETSYPKTHYNDQKVQVEQKQNIKLGFYPMYKKDYDVEGHWVVDFYYNSEGYRAPLGDLGTQSFWVLSDHFYYPNQITFNGASGRFEDETLYYNVRPLFCAGKNVSSTPSVPKISDVEKDSSGNVLLLRQVEASQYCSKVGRRLPSAFEYATWAKSFGAAGVVQFPDRGLWISAYDVVNPKPKILFFYSSIGYKQPSGESGKNRFWTSTSMTINCAENGKPECFNYVYDGANGELSPSRLGNTLAFRCLP